MNTRQILLTLQLKIKRLGDQAAELAGEAGERCPRPKMAAGIAAKPTWGEHPIVG